MSTAVATESPVMDLAETAAYCRRSVRAMYHLRYRRMGPPSFRKAGRVLFYKEHVDAWLRSGYDEDSQSNPDLDPTLKPPEPRKPRPRKTSHNGDGASARTLTPLAGSTPTRTGTHQ